MQILGDNYPVNLKIAIALRTARAALGWNQQEFADLMQVAKSTIARIETMEVTARGDFLTRALATFYQSGVELKILEPDEVTVVINSIAFADAKRRLDDESRRRSDRRVTTRTLAPTARMIKPSSK